MLKTNVAVLTAEERPPPDKYVMEYQIEHQRGFLVFGAPRFSANALFPLDPRHFTTRDNQPLGARLQDMEVPDDSWVWAWSRWYVDMTSNVDDQGWRYSWKFRSKNWSERHRFGRTFVRQRRWVRPRIKRSLIEDYAHEHAAPTTSKEYSEIAEEAEQVEEKIMKSLSGFRNDRETVDAIVRYIATHPDELPTLVRLKERIEDMLSFSISRQSLHDKLADSASDSCQRFVLAPSSVWREQVLAHGEPSHDPIDESDTEDPSNETVDMF